MRKKEHNIREYKDLAVILMLLGILVYLVFNLNRLEPDIYRVLDIHLGSVASYNVVKLTKQFLTVAVSGCLLSISLGLLIGVFCMTDIGKEFRPIIDKLSMLLRAFPEIAMIRFIVPLMGLGVWPSVIALTVHGVLPVIFAVTSGIDNIDPSYIKVAKGMGMNRIQIVKKVEIPQAIPVIISGMRVTVISCIGGATLATASGGEGLGILLGAGQETYNVVFIMECALLICLMSLIADKTLLLIEKKFYHVNKQ